MSYLLPHPVGRVLDLGAGTGALTRQLAERAEHVVVAEPDRQMIDVLVRRSPRVPATTAVGHRLPFRDGSFDGAFVASAWHWMDEALTVGELARVLAPGATLGIVWSGPDRSVEWVADLLGVAGTSQSQLMDQVQRRRTVTLPAGAPFGSRSSAQFSWELTRSVDELVGLAQTYSTMIVLDEQGRAAELARIRSVVDTRPEFAATSTVQLPMRALCIRLVRT